MGEGLDCALIRVHLPIASITAIYGHNLAIFRRLALELNASGRIRYSLACDLELNARGGLARVSFVSRTLNLLFAHLNSCLNTAPYGCLRCDP